MHCCVIFSKAPNLSEPQGPIWEMGMVTLALTASHAKSFCKSENITLLL